MYEGQTCGRYGKLTSRKRDKLPGAAFGLPSERKYPMPDPVHAASAKGRAKTQLNRGNLTRAQYNKIVRKADRVIKSCGGHTSGLGKAELVNVESRNKSYPGSFNIAPRSERKAHEVGEFVKLIWEDPKAGGERMWVEITEAKRNGDTRYRGELRNQPYVLEDVEWGDKITFGPEHVAVALGDWTIPAHAPDAYELTRPGGDRFGASMVPALLGVATLGGLAFLISRISRRYPAAR